MRRPWSSRDEFSGTLRTGIDRGCGGWETLGHCADRDLLTSVPEPEEGPTFATRHFNLTGIGEGQQLTIALDRRVDFSIPVSNRVSGAITDRKTDRDRAARFG